MSRRRRCSGGHGGLRDGRALRLHAFGDVGGHLSWSLAVLDDAGQEVALSDYFDFTIYVDAEVENVAKWFIGRFEKLRESAFTDPASYFHRYAEMDYEAALARAQEIWRTINLPNLVENIQPTKSRATLVLKKGKQHSVESVLLRKS